MATMHKPKFYLGRRDTRWDVYPQREPLTAIACDYQGYWEQSSPGVWFKTPTSFSREREISEEEAVQFAGDHGVRECLRGFVDGASVRRGA